MPTPKTTKHFNFRLLCILSFHRIAAFINTHSPFPYRTDQLLSESEKSLRFIGYEDPDLVFAAHKQAVQAPSRVQRIKEKLRCMFASKGGVNAFEFFNGPQEVYQQQLHKSKLSSDEVDRLPSEKRVPGIEILQTATHLAMQSLGKLAKNKNLFKTLIGQEGRTVSFSGGLPVFEQFTQLSRMLMQLVTIQKIYPTQLKLAALQTDAQIKWPVQLLHGTPCGRRFITWTAGTQS